MNKSYARAIIILFLVITLVLTPFIIKGLYNMYLYTQQDKLWEHHITIKLNDVNETFDIERNSYTKKHRSFNKPSSLSNSDIEIIGNNRLFINFYDSTRKTASVYASVDILGDVYKLGYYDSNTINTEISDVCKNLTKNTTNMSFSFTEHELCISKAKIILDTVISNGPFLCGSSKVIITKKYGIAWWEPNTCKHYQSTIFDSRPYYSYEHRLLHDNVFITN